MSAVGQRFLLFNRAVPGHLRIIACDYQSFRHWQSHRKAITRAHRSEAVKEAFPKCESAYQKGLSHYSSARARYARGK